MIYISKRFFTIIVNPFSVLGLQETATLAEAKAAYKKLVIKYHPDTSKTDDTIEKFREITEAFAILKKRLALRENIGIPTEEGFTSKRPKYDGHVGSVLRDDKIREYINFRPIDIKVPDKDRLGINYKPYFDDRYAMHPLEGTLTIMLCCTVFVVIYSFYLNTMEDRDDMVNQMLYERLTRKYESAEWDEKKLYPSLQVVQNDPDYNEFIQKQKSAEAKSKFFSLYISPSLAKTFNPQEFMKNEKPREYNSIKTENKINHISS